MNGGDGGRPTKVCFFGDLPPLRPAAAVQHFGVQAPPLLIADHACHSITMAPLAKIALAAALASVAHSAPEADEVTSLPGWDSSLPSKW